MDPDIIVRAGRRDMREDVHGYIEVLENDLAAKDAEFAALRDEVARWERVAQEGHPTPCDLGPLCPYCEIARLRSQLREAEAVVDGVAAELHCYQPKEVASLTGCEPETIDCGECPACIARAYCEKYPE